jgi:hypothetical protein
MAPGVDQLEGMTLASRAAQELASIAIDFELEAEQLEQYAAMRRGDMKLEREAIGCRTEARRVRNELERFGR